MKTLRSLALILLVSLAASAAFAEESQSLFDGKTLKGWKGREGFWSVQDGAITGQTTKEMPTKGNTFIIWQGGKVKDFELKLKFRIFGGNSGIQYRSKEVGEFVISGYQADFDGANTWAGTLYEEKGRGVLAKRGNKVVIHEDGTKETTGSTAPEKEIVAAIKKEDWNEYVITVKGNHLVQKINGVTTIDVTDNQEEKRAMSGLLALQLHAGPPMKVQFKDIELTPLQ